MNKLICFYFGFHTMTHIYYDESSDESDCGSENELISKADIDLIEKQANCFKQYLDHGFWYKGYLFMHEMYEEVKYRFTNKFYERDMFFNRLESKCIERFKIAADKLKEKIEKSKTDQIEIHPIEKMKKKAQDQIKLFEIIEKRITLDLSLKDTLTKQKILLFIENHENLVFFRYFKNFDLNSKCNSFHDLCKFFKEIIINVESKIIKLKNSTEFSKFIKNSVFNTMFNTVLKLRFKYNYYDATNEDEILSFKNVVFENLKDIIFKDFDKNFKSIVMNWDRETYELEYLFEDFNLLENGLEEKAKKDENLYEITFQNNIFIQNILIHFKCSLIKSLKTCWDDLLESKIQFSDKNSKESVSEKNDFFKNFYQKIFTDMEKFGNEKIRCINILSSAEYAFNKKFTKINCMFFMNVLVADYLITFENGEFLYDILKQHLKLKRCDLSDQTLIDIENRNVFSCDNRDIFSFFKTEIFAKTTNFTDIWPELIDENFQNEFTKLPMAIAIAYLKFISKKKHDFLMDIMEESYYNSILMSYDIHKFRTSSFDHFKNPMNDNYEKYQIVFYINSKYEQYDYNMDLDYIIDDDFGTFQSYLNIYFNSPLIIKDFKLELAKFLIKRPNYFEDEYKIEIVENIKKLISDLKKLYYDIPFHGTDYPLRRLYAGEVKNYLIRCFYLSLLDYYDYVQFKKSMNVFINQKIKDDYKTV